MPILKNNTQNNFVMVSKNITRDKNIGLTERGLLLTLMSLPDGWNLSIKGLAQILPDGKDKISKAMNNLIDSGYITREQERGFHGSFGANVLVIHETPINSTNPEGESSCNKSLPQAETPWTENPVMIENIWSLTNHQDKRIAWFVLAVFLTIIVIGLQIAIVGAVIAGIYVFLRWAYNDYKLEFNHRLDNNAVCGNNGEGSS